MAELKTKATKASVSSFINAIEDDQRRKDSKKIVAMMTKATKKKPVMWGPSIVGFGDHEYTGASRTSKWFEAGFSPRKAALTLYLMGGRDKDLLAKLGPHSLGGGCLYIKRLDQVDTTTLQKLIAKSVKQLRAKK
ncbi:MAG TPA: DUF1801 domain-containing protein [Vicinamibacterales bacterium]